MFEYKFCMYVTVLSSSLSLKGSPVENVEKVLYQASCYQSECFIIPDDSSTLHGLLKAQIVKTFYCL